MVDRFAEHGFHDVWTPVALASRLGNKPLAVTVAGVKIALFRRQGGVGALLDQCPHRGAALSLGEVTDDGCLRCPFHGWEFTNTGACALVPFNALSDEKLRNLATSSFPVVERGGLIWLFTRPGTLAMGEPILDESMTDPHWRVSFNDVTWRAHWSRVMENSLDAPHLPFVHRRTIGRDMRKRLSRHSNMRIETKPVEHGLEVHWQMDDDVPMFLTWIRPNSMRLEVTERRHHRAVLHLWVVPVDTQRTRMLVGMARNFGKYNPLMKVLELMNRRILLEDQHVIESITPLEAPSPSEERSVGTDRATLTFRRWYLARTGPARSTQPPQLPLFH